MTRLQDGSFPSMERITLLSFRLAMVNEGWNARDMRALLMLCKDKKIDLIFA